MLIINEEKLLTNNGKEMKNSWEYGICAMYMDIILQTYEGNKKLVMTSATRHY